MQDYMSIIINAFCTGIGVSLGSYFTNKMLIKQIEKEKKEGGENAPKVSVR